MKVVFEASRPTLPSVYYKKRTKARFRAWQGGLTRFIQASWWVIGALAGTPAPTTGDGIPWPSHGVPWAVPFGGRGLCVLGAGDLELAHAVPKSACGQSQERGSALRPCDRPIAFLQNRQNVRAVHVT